MNQVIGITRSALRYLFAVIGALLVALLLIVAFLGFTVPGARVVAWAIEKYAGTPDQIVRISDPGALLTGDFTAGSVTLFDGEGIYAEVRDLSVDWSPAELLSLRFDASRIAADSVRVERLPIPSTETKEVRSTFALPVDVKIDAFDLKEVMIGRKIAREDHFLTAKGKVDATNSSIALALDAAERDRPDARAVADLVFNPAGNQLKLQAEVTEPKGGLLAKLLRLPGEPAVDIRLTGEGPLSDWAGSGTASLDGAEVLKLDGRHELAKDGMHNLSVSGGGALASLMPPAFRPLFEGTSSIDLTAAFDGKSLVCIEAGRLSTGALTLDAAGTIDSRGENNLKASLTGTKGPIDFRWPLKEGELRALINVANLSLIGEGQSAILDVAADVPSVALPQGNLAAVRLSAQSDAFNLETQSGSLKTTVDIGETRFASADLQRAIQAPMKVDGTISVAPDEVRFDPLTIESASIGGSLTGRLDRADASLEAAFKLFAVPAVLPPALAAKLDKTIALSGNLATEDDGTLRLSALEIGSELVAATGSLALSGETLTADIQGTLPDIGRLLEDAKGAAAFHATASGPLSKLGVKADITSSSATLAGRTLSDLRIDADATVTPGSPEATLTATGTLEGQAIDMRAVVASKDGLTSLPTIEAKVGGNTLTGAIALTADFKPNGRIDFSLPDLGLLAAMAGQQASGDLAGTATVQTANGVTSVAIEAKGAGIRREALAVARPEVEIDIADVSEPAVRGAIRAESLSQGANRVSDVSLVFDRQAGGRQGTNFSADGLYDGAPLTAKGELASEAGRTEIRLASAAAAPRRLPLELAAPAVIAIENGVARLDDLTIRASSGTIAVSGTAGDRLDLAARLDDLPAVLINNFAPTLGAEGIVDGTIDIDGEAGAPLVEYGLSWRGASVSSLRAGGIAAQDLTARGTVSVSETEIRFDPTAISSAGFRGSISGSLSRAEKTAAANFRFEAEPGLLPEGLATRFDTPVAVSGMIETGGDGSVKLSALEVESGTVNAAGSATLAEGRLTADITGALPDLGKLLAEAEGELAFSADVSGPLDSLAIKGEVTSGGAVLAGRSLTELTVTADATVRPGNPQAKLNATGTLDGQVIDARADIVSEGGRTSIPSLEARIGNNRLAGALDLTADFKPNGKLDFTLPDLGLLAAMAGQQASGDLAGSATLQTANGVTSAVIKANGGSIRRGELAIAKPEVDLAVADIARLAISGAIRAESIAQGENRVTDVDIAFDQQAGRTGFSLQSLLDGAPLTAKGELASNAGRTEIRLASFSAAPRRLPLELAAPTVVTIEKGVARLDALTIRAATGTVAVTGAAGERIDIAAKVDALPATLIHAFLPTLGAQGTIAGTVNVDGEARAPVVGYDLTWGGASLAPVRSAGIPAQDLTAKGTITVTEASIAFDPTITGSAGLRGKFRGSLDRAASAATADFEIEAEPGALPKGIAGKFDGPVAISGKVETGGDGKVELSDLAVKSGTVEASGSANLAEGRLVADIEGALPDLGKLLADAEGKAAFDADISGPLDALAVKGELTSSGAVLAGRSLTDLTVTADATIKPGSPQAKLTATGGLDGQPIDVRAEVVPKDGRTSVPVLAAKIGDNRLSGAIELTPDMKPSGTIDFDLPDLGLVAAMAGQKASGDLSGSATIRTVNGTTSVSLKASGRAIKRDQLTITRPVADIGIADLAALAIRGDIKAESVAQGQNRVTNVSLAFEQQGGRTGFAIDGRYDGAPLAARGDLVVDGGRTEIRLASFSAAPRKVALKLAKPTVVAIENGAVSLGDLTIQASKGAIAVTGTAGPSLDISARLNALPATLINTFAPALGAEGAINGTVEVSGTAAAPVVDYDLRWNAASVAAARGAGVAALEVSAKGRFANNRVTVDVTVRGPGDLSFRGGGQVDMGGNMPLSMKFAGDVPFGLLANTMAEQGFTLTGSANVDLALTGSARAPQIAGRVSTAGGRLVDVRRNLALNDLAADVALDGRQASISRLSANLATGGSIEASGTVGIAAGSGFPADLRIRLNNATYVDGTLFTANLAGDLTLKGPLVSTPVLGGRLTIRRAAITVPEKLPASLAAIDIKHRNAPARVREMARDLRKDTSGGAGAKAAGVIAFDLAVHSPGQFFVRGRGIDAELGGDLTIRGNAAQPIVSGGFDMRRGRLEILGKRLTFTEGHIGFGGGLIPTLDLDASSSAGSTTITVNVAGPANNPQVTFSSSPALPQDEILAQLIFNRSLNNLSAFQIAQLASAVSQLAGGGSTSLLDGLRNKLGVDDLDITTDESGGAQVTAGKYLNDRTYLELQQGSDSASSKAIINLDVGRGVKLKGEAAGDGSAAGGIFFEREY
ncbi:translocation/assembly module TamB domain-containing protein [Sinorhizobium saheli]|uniref:translocation/assembly module TamB domain-containing protein n=1 Tax=Sinorhizobium saheli TaxID=36856 RepID=UPI000836B2F5|nr:translocation/assembly module TamB domain-containing protein [Sinorhizobium saheli]MQW86020.1 translocation/assembly module TamB [Sinorhizobium saheli]